MVDIARLGIEVATDALRRAMADLDRFGDRAGDAERDVERFGNTARTVFGAIAGAAATLGAGFSLSEGIQSAIGFDAALREVSTLFPVLNGQMEEVSAAARGLASEFGGSATPQVQAFYQAISAGASDVAEATAVVDAANRLATGGLVDVTTGVDVLTTATNAYAASGLSAIDASDSLFVAMRAGKTTIGELASSLGNVIPTAAALGVGFDELNAGVAALTTQGLSTASAVTGLRAILSQVAAPTEQARKVAKALGIEYSVAALQAKGLAGFLADVTERTGGDAAALAQLFGSIEALNAALSFAGGAGESFNAILDDMREKAGSTNEAMARIDVSWTERIEGALTPVGASLRNIGEVALNVLVPGLEGAAAVLSASLVPATAALAANADTLAKGLFVVGAGMTAAFGPQILAMVGGLTVAIGTRMVGAVNALTAAIARNPFGALAVAAAAALGALFAFREEIREASADAQNASPVMRGLAGALDVIGRAANGAAAAIGGMLDRLTTAGHASARLNDQLAEVDMMLQRREEDLAGHRALAAGGSVFSSRQAARLEGIVEELRTERAALLDAQRILETPSFNERVPYSPPAPAAPQLPEIVAPDISGLLAGAGGRESENALERWLQSTRERTEALRLEAETFGMAQVAIDAHRLAFEGLNAAKEAGVPITSALVESINAEAQAQAAATEQLRLMQEEQQHLDQIKSTVASGLTDMFMGIVTGSKSASDAIRGLATQLLSMAANRMFMRILDGAFGGAGGGAGGPLNLLSFLRPRDSGGPAMAGMPYMVGAGRGPEIFVPETAGRVVPNHMLGGPANDRGPAPVLNYAPVIDARGADAARVQQLELQMREQARGFEKRVSAFINARETRNRRA
ncbi:phage tail tape measure protein [Salinarimonas sp. NSM]|uniref:phage tail tape measure protein n=1 Tax=Salinarimonas sp. NSM TaxID=3458003 RepID=UPI0040360703